MVLQRTNIAELAKILEDLNHEGSLKDLGYDTDTTRLSLYDLASNILKGLTRNHVYKVIYKNRIGGVVWFDNIDDTSARIHMAACRWTWGRNSLKMGRLILKEASSKYGIIIGETPKHLRSMLAYTKRLGFKDYKILKAQRYVHTLNKHVDLIIQKFTQKEGN